MPPVRRDNESAVRQRGHRGRGADAEFDATQSDQREFAANGPGLRIQQPTDDVPVNAVLLFMDD